MDKSSEYQAHCLWSMFPMYETKDPFETMRDLADLYDQVIATGREDLDEDYMVNFIESGEILNPVFPPFLDNLRYLKRHVRLLTVSHAPEGTLRYFNLSDGDYRLISIIFVPKPDIPDFYLKFLIVFDRDRTGDTPRRSMLMFEGHDQQMFDDLIAEFKP